MLSSNISRRFIRERSLLGIEFGFIGSKMAIVLAKIIGDITK